MAQITVKNISKKFKIGFKKNQSVLARFLSLFSGREPKRLITALDKVSFEVKQGEILGVIGSNGSGKSTLLRIIAGIYSHDEGEVLVDGRMISLINLIVGLKDRLAMKDNIFLIGSLFGSGQKDIIRNFKSIVNFSGLQEFINTKIYQFSEGMKQRLAFSIAVHCNPEILLLDEVFEVGDEEFRKKSADKIKELAKNGSAVLLVSHDLDMVQKYCSRTLWMDKGKVLENNATEKVLEKYKKMLG